jgi:hypothetical protein
MDKLAYGAGVSMNQQIFLQAAYSQGVKLACANANLSPEEFEKQAAGALKKIWEGAKSVGQRFMPQASRDKSFLSRVDAQIAGGHGAKIPEDIMNRYVHVLNRPPGRAAGKAYEQQRAVNAANAAKTPAAASAEVHTSGPFIMGAPAPASAMADKATRQQKYKKQLKEITDRADRRAQGSAYRKALGEAHKSIKAPGMGATALGGALVGGGVGAVTSDKDQFVVCPGQV